MSERQGLLSIGELARLAETTARTIRYYEELGILIPPHRTTKGMRRYTAHEVARLQAIKALQDCDYSLAEIAELVSARFQAPTGTEAGQRIQRIFERKLLEIDERIVRYQHLKQDLVRSIEALTDCCVCHLVPSAEVCQTCQLSSLDEGEELPRTFEATF